MQQLFSSIALKYDLLNSLLSFGMHSHWKRFAAEQTGLGPGDTALDICSGTGDLAVLLARMVEPRGKVMAIDFCEEMLELAKRKARRAGVENLIDYIIGNAENLEIPSDSFCAATIGFGLRNVNSIAKTLQEMYRILKRGGRAVCLEFSYPYKPWLRALYDFYSFRFIPQVGKLISKNKSAYLYLPTSIRSFPNQESLKGLMAEAGFQETRYYDLSGGIVAVHVGVKR